MSEEGFRKEEGVLEDLGIGFIDGIDLSGKGFAGERDLEVTQVKVLDLLVGDIGVEVDIKLRVTDIDDLVFFGE